MVLLKSALMAGKQNKPRGAFPTKLESKGYSVNELQKTSISKRFLKVTSL